MKVSPQIGSSGALSRRPSLLMVSPVAPWPADMAAKVRIANILEAVSRKFEVTFVARCDPEERAENESRLYRYCRETILLPPLNRKTSFSRVFHRLGSSLAYHLFGFSRERYYAGYLNLSKERLVSVLPEARFDLALFEYWFAADSVDWFRQQGIPCFLDMHDIMWRKHLTSTVAHKKGWKGYWHYVNRRYRQFEENTWSSFDGIVTINQEEDTYVRSRVDLETAIIMAGTGVDLQAWPYLWGPASPPRLIFYGALGNRENERAAWRCLIGIMPTIWAQRPEVELWLVGSHPPPSLINFAQTEPRVRVTGFVDEVKEVLAGATLVLCPLEGQFGFRSRLIEVMALGVPVIASTQAVYGMLLENGKGLAILDEDPAMAEQALEWLASPAKIHEQSLLARQQVEQKYSFGKTYEKITEFLLSMLRNQG